MLLSVALLATALTCALASPSPQNTPITAAPGSLAVGAVCSSTAQCAHGAQCYGVSSSTITTCGSFQATCFSDIQCATNTCQNGFCAGPLLSSSISTATTPSPILSATFPTVTAANGTLGLGAICSYPAQCAGGADCYGVTAFTIRTCGSFQAVCSTDSQCATNNCVGGLCNGFLASESYRITRTTTTALQTGTSGSNLSMTVAAGSTTAAAAGSTVLAGTTAQVSALATNASTAASPSATKFVGEAARVGATSYAVLAAVAALLAL